MADDISIDQLDGFIKELERHGALFWVGENEVHYRAPREIITPKKLAFLKAHREKILVLLKDRPSTDPQSHPLSYGQQALWTMYKRAPDSPAYNVVFAARVHTKIDVPALRSALNRIVQRHPILRTVYTNHSGKPRQKVLEQQEVVLSVEQVDDGISDQVLVQIGDQPIDIEKGPLIRIQLYHKLDNSFFFILYVHHIAVDFWSLDIIAEELALLYQAEKVGIQVPKLPLLRQYTDYVQEQNRYLNEPAGKNHWEYWRKKLQHIRDADYLPLDRPRPERQTYAGNTFLSETCEDSVRKLQQLADNEHTTLFTIYLSVFLVLLHRYSGQNDIIIGSPTAGRDQLEYQRVVGYFVNPIAIRADFSEDPSFRSFLWQIKKTVLESLEHAAFPFPLLIDLLQPSRSPDRSPLFQTMFVWQQSRIARLEENDIFEPVYIGQRGAAFDLSFVVAGKGERISCLWQYNTDLFNPETITRIAGHYEMLISSVLSDPDQQVSMLPLLTETERPQLLVEWNDSQKNYPPDICLHDHVEAQVRKTPEAVAVIIEDQQLTYRELNRQANQLVYFLREKGVTPGNRVGVCMDRSIEMIVTLLGILKAGAVYVPLEPSYPVNRLDSMVDDAQIQVIVAQESVNQTWQKYPGTFVNIEKDWPSIERQPTGNPTVEITPDHAAYIMYTSGSTGNPKGVIISHKGICNRLLWMQETYQLTSLDRVLHKTPFSFDVSVWEIFWPLIAGGQVILAQPGGEKDTRYLAELIERQQVTTVHFVPAMLELFLKEALSARCMSLENVFSSGDILRPALQQAFFDRLDAYLNNLYGPTEASIDVTAWQCRTGDQRVPIGRPIANTEIFILDAHMQPVPVGVPGEIYIGGAGLALGYVNRPSLTDERFVPHPLSDRPGDRLFKTGDRARYLPDGNIMFLGRLDDQVKIGGIRIEPGEIEAVLERHPDIDAARIVAREINPDDKRLVAYLKIKAALPPPISMVRYFLKQKLPDNMIPSAYVYLREWPMTATGKLDREALPLPNIARPELEVEYVAPRNAIEERIAEMWKEVLDLDKVGVNDNFFDLGGASLQAIQLYSKAVEAGIALEPENLFEYQTVSQLAEAVQAKITDDINNQQQSRTS